MIDFGIYHQSSNDGVDDACVCFYTKKHAYEFAPKAGRAIKYLYKVGLHDTDKGEFFCTEFMTIADIGELVLIGERGMDLQHVTHCTEEQLEAKAVEFLKDIMVDMVDEGLEP